MTQRHIGTQRKVVLQRVAKLTRREKEVLALMVTGQQSKAIGYKLGVHGENNQTASWPRPPENGSKKSCRTGADDSRDILVIKQTKVGRSIFIGQVTRTSSSVVGYF